MNYLKLIISKFRNNKKGNPNPDLVPTVGNCINCQFYNIHTSKCRHYLELLAQLQDSHNFTRDSVLRSRNYNAEFIVKQNNSCQFFKQDTPIEKSEIEATVAGVSYRKIRDTDFIDWREINDGDTKQDKKILAFKLNEGIDLSNHCNYK